MLFLFSLAFAFYYYGIQKGFTPNSENLASIWVAYHNVHNGEQLLSNDLWIKLCEVAATIWGLSYKSLRMVNTFMYFMITFFALDLSIRSKEGNIRWYAIPMYMLFMVMMHHGDSVYFGQLTGQVYQYPFDQHMLANFAAIFCVWIVYRINNSSKYRIIQYVSAIIIMIFCVKETDLLYLVTFLVPFLLVILLKIVKHDRMIVTGLGLVFLGIAVCRFLSQYIPFFSSLFANSTGRYSEGYVYGATNFESIGNLVRNFLNYVGGLSGLFNFDFSGASVFNLNLIIYLVRIILLCVIFYYVGKKTKNIIFMREIEDIAESIIIVGIVLLSVFFIFTDHGNNIMQMRYLDMILPYGTILLCWHIDDFSKIFNLSCLSNKDILFCVACLCVIASHDYRWGHEKLEDEWDKEYEYVLELVEDNNLHEGIAGLWTFASISAVGEGEHILNMGSYKQDTKTMELKYLLTTQYFYDYILLGKDGLNAMEASIELLEESYGKADEIIETERYYLVIYRNGIFHNEFYSKLSRVEEIVDIEHEHSEK